MTKKTLQIKAFKAFKEAIRGVVEQHKRTGRPLVIWQNGKVAKISPGQIRQKK